MVAQAFRAGGIDSIQKPLNANVMLDRIYEAIQRGEAQHRRQAQNQELARLVAVEQGEAQVMQLLVDGASTKSIARQLTISPKTVDNHRVRILQKAQVSNTVELTRLIYSNRRVDDATVDEARAETPLRGDGLARSQRMSLAAVV